MEALLASELSADTLAALQAHLQAQQQESDAQVAEDFRLSQFWYDVKTGTALAQEAMDQSKELKIAFVSTPAAYRDFLTLIPEDELATKYANVVLFEYDLRFEEKYGADHFAFYDYNSPTDLPAKFHHFFDYILVDPPHLNPTCMGKYAETMRWLAKDVQESSTPGGKARILSPCTFITGGMLRKPIYQNLGFKPSGFYPTFESKLSNQFLTYTNYESARFGPCTEDYGDSDDEHEQ